MNGISFVVMFSLTMQLVPGAKRWNDSGLHSPSCSLTEFSRIGQCLRLNHLLTCRNGFASEWIWSIQEDISHLTILEWPGKCFNISELHQHYPELQIIEFVNSSTLNSFVGQFGASNKIEKIVMHGLTALWEVPPSMVSDMPRLRELDLRGNVLRHLKIQTLTNPPQLHRVFLGDNKWDCSDGGLDWLAMEEDNSTVKNIIADYNKLMCHQQLYRGKPLHKVMDVIRMVRQTCPPSCICAMTYVVSDSAGGIIPLITTDCARRGLKEVPEMLPPSTTTLRLEGNKINTIRMMVQNPQYKNVMELYLDNNSISSVKELEGSELFMTLRVLSLKGNLLKQIPVYAFDKAFQTNTNIMHVFLSHNPWRCDCHYLPRFQGLLLKYKKVIRDFQDVRCSMSEDKTVSLAQISTILPGNVCGSSDVNITIDYINIINLVLFILILLVVSKFLYDWHSFKTTGKLPWLSSILP